MRSCWVNQVMSESIIVPSHDCTISWRSWALFDRDAGEMDRVSVNNQVIWEKAVVERCETEDEGWSPVVLPLTGIDCPNGNCTKACFVDACVSVSGCGGNPIISFSSDTDESLSKEGWAFSHVTVAVGGH